MKRNAINASRILTGSLAMMLMVGLATAQQPSPSPKKPDDTKAEGYTEAGDDAGDYHVISSYRGWLSRTFCCRRPQQVPKRSELQGRPTALRQQLSDEIKDGKGELFDTLLVTSTGWGADPQGNLRISVENPKWYRFDGTYRRFKYFRFLNSFANPNWVFQPGKFQCPAEAGYRRARLRHKNERWGFRSNTSAEERDASDSTVGYSPERYSGPAFTNYHCGRKRV